MYLDQGEEMNLTLSLNNYIDMVSQVVRQVRGCAARLCADPAFSQVSTEAHRHILLDALHNAYICQFLKGYTCSCINMSLVCRATAHTRVG